MLPFREQPCPSWNSQDRFPTGRWPAPGSGKAVALLLTWVDGGIIATGGQGGPLTALPLLLHLFFQDQLAEARVELFMEERKMKEEPAVTFRGLQFLFSGSCKKFLTLKRPEVYCPQAWGFPQKSARFRTSNPTWPLQCQGSVALSQAPHQKSVLLSLPPPKCQQGNSRGSVWGCMYFWHGKGSLGIAAFKKKLYWLV